MDPRELPSARRLGIGLIVVAMVWVLVPATVQAAGPALVRLVDGDGSSRVQVDKGKVRVGDGAGAMTVDKAPAALLRSGQCEGQASATTTLPVGTVVTSMFLTGNQHQYPGARLDIFPGATTVPPLMSLKVGFGPNFEGDYNAIYSSDSGFKVTGAVPWSVVCGGIISSSGSNGAVYSIFGYPA